MQRKMQMNAIPDQSSAETATDRLYLEMRKRVLDGRLRGGQIIQIPSVLSFFECGMTPTREAMRRLRLEGYFTQDTRGRNYVRNWSQNDLVDAWTLGATIWGYSALRFAERADTLHKTRLNTLMNAALEEGRADSGDMQFVLSAILVTLHVIGAKSQVHHAEATLDDHIPVGLRRMCLQALTGADLQRLCSQLQNAVNFALAGQAQLASQGVEMAVRSILAPATEHFCWLASLPTTTEAVFDDDGDVEAPKSPRSDLQPFYGTGTPEIADIDQWIARTVKAPAPHTSDTALTA